jgi:hypothetical protein
MDRRRPLAYLFGNKSAVRVPIWKVTFMKSVEAER